MIRRILKRLLEYCPHPSKPLTTTLKPYTLPIAILVTASIAMVSYYYFVVLPGTTPQTITPQIVPSISLNDVLAVESNYYPGVIVGDYVKYGDFHCNVSHPTGPEWEWLICLGERDWINVEVVEVAGEGVTLRYTDQLKNGSATNHNGCVHLIYNVDHPTVHNGTCGFYSSFNGHIVAANLTEGNSIHSDVQCIPPHTVNKTEIRTYMGVDRWVNIIKFIDEPAERFWVFDGESGVLLEYEEISPNNLRSGYRIVETNIFPSPSTSTRSSLIRENIETGITPEDPYHSVYDDLVEADFKIWIGNGELSSPEEEDVVFQWYDGKDYFLVEDYVGGFWEPPSTEDDVYEGWSVHTENMNLGFGEEPKPCGTCDVNDQDLIDKLIEIGIYPIKEKEVSTVFMYHNVGNYSTTGDPPDDLALGDFWFLGIRWKIGEFEIENPEWSPDPIVVPQHYMLDGTTDKGIEPEGEYDETTDIWTITFDTVFELSESTPEPNPETGEWSIKLWEGPLRFTVKIQRILTQ